MTVTLSIAELVAAFPAFEAAVVVAEDLSIPAERPASLDAEIARREVASRAQWTGTDLSAIPGIAAWRQAYRAFGIKKTSYRCSVERIVKNILAERSLPRINGFVDAYNAVSLSSVLCVGADDLDTVVQPLAFRFSRPGDSFIDMAAEPGEDPNDPPKDGEVVYADAAHVLCRRWNWRQDAQHHHARHAQGRGDAAVQRGRGRPGCRRGPGDLLAAHCGAACRVSIASAGQPIVMV